jgi:putative transposase
MGRIPRLVAPGVYHVTAKGNNAGELFRDDLDREDFLATVGRVVERQMWKCHAYCLMTNHFHLMVETSDESLPAGMHRLNLAHAKSFNRRYGRTGHVFQGRYYSVPVITQGHALLLIRYLARNPAEAGICRMPEEWPWSSYGATLGLRRAPACLTTSWVLGLFADDRVIARRRLRAFVNGTRFGKEP